MLVIFKNPALQLRCTAAAVAAGITACSICRTLSASKQSWSDVGNTNFNLPSCCAAPAWLVLLAVCRCMTEMQTPGQMYQPMSTACVAAGPGWQMARLACLPVTTPPLTSIRYGVPAGSSRSRRWWWWCGMRLREAATAQHTRCSAASSHKLHMHQYCRCLISSLRAFCMHVTVVSSLGAPAADSC